MGSPAIFKGNFVKLLKSKIQFFNDKEFVTDDSDNPNSTAKSMAGGSLYQRHGTDDLFIKRDGGSTTNFSKFVKGFSFSGINLYPRGDMESALISDYTASGGVTASITSTAAEVGDGSKALKVISTALNDTIESANIPIPLGYRLNQYLSFKMIYNASAAWTVTITDKTNSLTLLSESIPAVSAYTPKELIFPINSTTENISFTFTASTANTLLVDNVVITPDFLHFGEVSAFRDPVSFTPTGSWSSNVTYTGSYTRMGKWGRFEYRIAATGATTAADLSLNLPSGLTIDASSIVGDDADNRALTNGSGVLSDGAATWYNLKAKYSTTSAFLIVHQDAAANLIQTNNTAPVTIANGDEVYFTIDLPISEWSSVQDSIITSSANFAPSRYSSATAQSFADSTDVVINYDVKTFDDDNLVTTGTWVWTAPRQGKVSVDASVRLNAFAWPAGSFFSLGLQKNGSLDHYLTYDEFIQLAAGGYNHFSRGGSTIQVNKGDTLRIVVLHNFGSAVTLSPSSTFNYVNIRYIDNVYSVNAALPATVVYGHSTTGSTAGGASTANTVQTRTLAYLSGDRAFSSVSSNQVTLIPGKYLIKGFASGYNCNRHQAYAYNTTAAAVASELVGSSQLSSTAPANASNSIIEGVITLTANATFELRHWTESTRATDGLGVSTDDGTNNDSAANIYAKLSITKLR